MFRQDLQQTLLVNNQAVVTMAVSCQSPSLHHHCRTGGLIIGNGYPGTGSWHAHRSRMSELTTDAYLQQTRQL
eukprot:5171400-Amphidinium_carterae.1